MTPVRRTPILADSVTPVDHSDGPDHAVVTVVEYGDFECPACAAAEPAVRRLRELHAGELRFVFRHFPLEDVHPHALLAAEAAEAAAAQGQFWAMHDRLLANSRHLERRRLDEFAAEIGLDVARFKAELDDDIYRQRIREHQDGARRSHLRGTPAFFVNGVFEEVGVELRELFKKAAELIAATRRS